MPTFLIEQEHQTHLDKILRITQTLAMDKKDYNLPNHLPNKFSIKLKFNFAKERNLCVWTSSTTTNKNELNQSTL